MSEIKDESPGPSVNKLKKTENGDTWDQSLT